MDDQEEFLRICQQSIEIALNGFKQSDLGKYPIKTVV